MFGEGLNEELMRSQGQLKNICELDQFKIVATTWCERNVMKRKKDRGH
jgi:hypothetical protein